MHDDNGHCGGIDLMGGEKGLYQGQFVLRQL
jgi:hypothetical protein